MMDVKESTFSSFLNDVKNKAARLNERRFASITKEIFPVSLLDIFDKYANKAMNRYYWSNSRADFFLLGIGIAKEVISPNGDMKQLQKDWNNMLQHADEYNPYGLPGTGITALGGKSFDPSEKSSVQWKHYPPAKMVIPDAMIAYSEGRYFLTVNYSLDKQTMISDLLDSMHTLEQELENQSPEPTESFQKVLSKEEIKPEEWKNLVQKAVDEIKEGHAKKIVLAREIKVKLDRQAHLGGMLRKLMRSQPNSYIFAYEAGDDCFLGATPERLVQVEGESLLSTCLAGTAPRGSTTASDNALADELLHDKKNLEEHAYVVQMIKDSIDYYCEDIDIPEEPVIYPLKNMQHLYTPVRGKLKKGHDVFDLVDSLHPTPALGGVPREKALEFIRDEEFMERGWYGAPVGWLDSSHHSEFAVAIRSGLAHGDEVTLFAGCGVMRDSDPEMEYEETKVKFMPMLHVLEDNDESY